MSYGVCMVFHDRKWLSNNDYRFGGAYNLIKLTG